MQISRLRAPQILWGFEQKPIHPSYYTLWTHPYTGGLEDGHNRPIPLRDGACALTPENNVTMKAALSETMYTQQWRLTPPPSPLPLRPLLLFLLRTSLSSTKR